MSTKIFTGPDYSLITVAMVHVYLQDVFTVQLIKML